MYKMGIFFDLIKIEVILVEVVRSLSDNGDATDHARTTPYIDCREPACVY